MKLIATARQTFRELLFERVLYNVIFVSLFLLFFGYLAALLVFGRQDRVMLDFGTLVNAVSVYFVAASAGARVLRKEIEDRTLYLALSRPVSRPTYFFAKWFGISAFTLVNLALLTAVLAIGLSMTGGGVTQVFFQSMALIWCESLMVTAMALTLSLFLRPGITVMFTLAYLFVSHNHAQLSFVAHQGAGISAGWSFLQWVTPDGQVFLLDTRVYYEQALRGSEFILRFGYGLLWSLFFILIGNAAFYRKNI
jgi:ABC-type transport system involved in multi-copper enzyme maturation permease subunit